jgi:hypothetical protein
MAAMLLFATAAPVLAGDETCDPIAVGPNTPSGIAGCTLDGPTDGVASWYHGTVAAANWCVYPWKNCQPVSVQSHRTGITIIITPGSFCDCWWMTDRRLIDLTPSQFAALGESTDSGLIAVTVTPVNSSGLSVEQDIGMPDTSLGQITDLATLTVVGWLLLCFAALALIDHLWFRGRKRK